MKLFGWSVENIKMKVSVQLLNIKK